MTAEQQSIGIIARLDAQPDEALRAIIMEANTILESRAAARVRDAIAEIRRLARESGLTVEVRKAGRKGRPPRELNSGA